MYLDFYGFKERPFTLSPNPKYLYYSRSHKEAYAQFIYALTEQYGYMVMTGEVGTGKTTLANAMVKSLKEDFNVAKIDNAVKSPKGLLQSICRGYNINFGQKTMAELALMLQEYLRSKENVDKRCVLIFDEAQNLNERILEEIRLLSNFQAMENNNLQMILVGQPEFETTLQSTNLRQLRERVSFEYELKKLTEEETSRYIKHRLYVAGCQVIGDLFTDNAHAEIFHNSDGIPRRINKICDKALILGYAKNICSIDEHVIQDVLTDRVITTGNSAYSEKYIYEKSNNGKDRVYQKSSQVAVAEALPNPSNQDKSRRKRKIKKKKNTSGFDDQVSKYLRDSNIFLIPKKKFAMFFGGILAAFAVILFTVLLTVFFLDKIGLLK